MMLNDISILYKVKKMRKCKPQERFREMNVTLSETVAMQSKLKMPET